MDLQSSYSSIMRDYRINLIQWLEKQSEANEIEDFEDRDLDAILLQVPRQPKSVANPDRTVSRTTSSTRFFTSIINRSADIFPSRVSWIGVYFKTSTMFSNHVPLH
jgi:hypothetical protein